MAHAVVFMNIVEYSRSDINDRCIALIDKYFNSTLRYLRYRFPREKDEHDFQECIYDTILKLAAMDIEQFYKIDAIKGYIKEAAKNNMLDKIKYKEAKKRKRSNTYSLDQIMEETDEKNTLLEYHLDHSKMYLTSVIDSNKNIFSPAEYKLLMLIINDDNFANMTNKEIGTLININSKNLYKIKSNIKRKLNSLNVL